MAKRRSYPGHVERRGDKWRVRLDVNGKTHRYTVPGDREDAETFAEEEQGRLQEEARRVAEGRPGPLTFSKLAAEYERLELPSKAAGTQKSYGTSLGALREYFAGLGDPKVTRIRRGHVARFRSWRRTRGGTATAVSDHTVARDMRVLHLVLAWALELDYIDANPAAGVSKPKPDGREYVILTDPQLEKLLGKLHHHPMARTYVLLLAETGLRSVSEALWLRWADVDLQDGFLWVASGAEHRTKSGKGRWVPLTPRARAALQEHTAAFRFAAYGREQRRSPWVFHHLVTRRKHKAGDRVHSFRAAVERAATAAKLPAGWRIHDLRHRRVTTWLAEGRSPALVQEAMGHSSPTVTAIYTHLAREHLRALVDDGDREALRQLAAGA